MVEERLNTSSEFEQVKQVISEGKNFLLSGGAGSGKTYSLVQIVRYVIESNPTTKIACITYTNAAVKEIEERVDAKNLVVSTIHDFLWDNIKHFNKELKQSLIKLINNEDVNLSISGTPQVEANFFDDVENIQYKEYLRLREGIISHDEVILLAEYMFSTYPKLCDIVKDRFKYIFVDEYQDTHPNVVKILLEHFSRGQRKCIVGFFGDSMQAIYDDGVGNLDSYIGGAVEEIIKEHNRRNPQNVIDLANRLRTDAVVQIPSEDTGAPNMFDGVVKNGNILFIHSNDGDLSKVREFLANEYEWDFSNSKATKELNLTHNLIAGKAGFRSLYDIYDRDPILTLKNEIATKIKNGSVTNVEDGDTFDMVVDKAMLRNRQRELKKDIICADAHTAYLYNKLKDLPYKEVRQIYVTKEQLIDDKKQDSNDESSKGSQRDNLIKHLFKIENIISLYNEGRYSEFLKVTDYKKIKTIHDKRELKMLIETLSDINGKTIEEVINIANDNKICIIDEKLERFISNNSYIYNRVIKIEYKEFRALFRYLEGYTPFSTQHKTKGDEFDNVFVILDNGNWNNFNFQSLFVGGSNQTVMSRTKKIFYVCCTRAKEQLAVYYHAPSQSVLNVANDWFNGNVINIDQL